MGDVAGRLSTAPDKRELPPGGPRSAVGSRQSAVGGPWSIADLAAWVRPGATVVGELADADRRELAARLPAVTRLVPADIGERRPGTLARLAVARLAAGAADDLATLEPVYLGTTPVRRRAGRDANEATSGVEEGPCTSSSR